MIATWQKLWRVDPERSGFPSYALGKFLGCFLEVFTLRVFDVSGGSNTNLPGIVSEFEHKLWIRHFENYFTSSDPHHDIYRFVTGKSSCILSDISSGIRSGILSGISSGIYSGISSGMSSGILSGISSGRCSGISSGILSGISSGIPSDILSGISSGILSAR